MQIVFGATSSLLSMGWIISPVILRCVQKTGGILLLLHLRLVYFDRFFMKPLISLAQKWRRLLCSKNRRNLAIVVVLASSIFWWIFRESFQQPQFSKLRTPEEESSLQSLNKFHNFFFTTAAKVQLACTEICTCFWNAACLTTRLTLCRVTRQFHLVSHKMLF